MAYKDAIECCMPAEGCMLDVRAVELENAEVEYQHQGRTTLRQECRSRTPTAGCPEEAAAWTCRRSMQSGHMSAVRSFAAEAGNTVEDVAAWSSPATRDSATGEVGPSSDWAERSPACPEVEEGNALLGMGVTCWTWVLPVVEGEHSAGSKKHGADRVDSVLEYAAQVC